MKKRGGNIDLNFFAKFDEDRDGLVNAKRVCSFWKASGIAKPKAVLEVIQDYFIR